MAFIDAKKLLNASNEGGNSARVSQPKMFLVPVKNTEYKQTVDLSQQIDEKELTDPEKQVVEDVKVIREKVVKIEDILKKTIKINVKKIQLRAKQDEDKKRKDQEDKLEQKKQRKTPGLPNIPIPGMSIFDRIKQFLGTIFTGFLVLRIFRLLPKLVEFLDYIKPVTAFIEDFVKGMFDKFVTTIDLGYKLVDGAQSKIKELFGDDGEKKFNEFTSTFTKFMNLAIIAGMATMGGEDPLKDKRFKGPERRGFDRSGRRVNARAQQRYARRFGDRQYGDRFGNRNLRRLKGQTPRATQGFDQRIVQRGVTKIAGKRVGRIAGKVPIVGPLIDFGIRTLVFKEPLGKAAAGAVGAGVGQALGTWLGGTVGTVAGSVVPIVGNLIGGAAGATIGGIIGGLIGDQIGVSLYNVITKSSPEKIEGRARGGKVGDKNRRDPGLKYTPKKRRKPVPITKLKVDKTTPGITTGQKKIKDLYATTDFNKQPVRNLVEASGKLKQSKTSVFSKIMSMGIDLMLGHKPSKTSQRNVAKAFAALFSTIQDPSSNSISNEITRAIQSLAAGGEILSDNSQVKRKNESIIALMKSIENVLTKDLNLFNTMLGIRSIESSDSNHLPIEYGPLPLNMTQKQAFSTIYELAKRHKASMPELVAAMAMNESGYLTSLLAREYNNPFGQTGSGTKGSTRIPGNSRTFAVYNSLSDAVKFHVEKWNNDSSYGKGAGSYSSPVEGLRAILPIYDPGGNHQQYIKNVSSILSTMGFDPKKKNAKTDLSTTALIQQRRSLPGGTILPPQSVPGNLRDTGLKDSSGRPIKLKGAIADAFIDMAAAARKDGIDLGSGISNAFRDPEHNARVGGAQGSRHLTGEAFDINWYSAAGRWIRNNASRFGFQYNTYSGESTHFDWVGGYTPQNRQTRPSQPKVVRSTKINGNVFTEREGGKYFKNNKPVTKDVYDTGVNTTQASIAPTRPNSGSIASLNQRASYDTDGTTHVLIVEVV